MGIGPTMQSLAEMLGSDQGSLILGIAAPFVDQDRPEPDQPARRRQRLRSGGPAAGDEVPLTFTFGQRIVWDARISDASDEALREVVRDGLEFFTLDRTSPEQPAEEVKLSQRSHSGTGSGCASFR